MPSPRTLRTVLDVLHMFALHGERQPRDEVVDYLRRAMATGRRPTADTSLRAYERFKQALTALGIEHRSIMAFDGTAFLWIRRPGAAKARIEKLLDASDERVAAK